MSSRAEKAAALRAKILAKSKDRMAAVSGLPVHAAAQQENANTTATDAPSEAERAAALDAALDELAASSTADSAAAAVPAPAPPAARAAVTSESPAEVEEVADPHEFPSHTEVSASQLQDEDEDEEDEEPPHPFSMLTARRGVSTQEADPFQAFAAAAAQAMGGAAGGGSGGFAAAAALRRQQKDAAASARLTESLDLPPARSPLARWTSRVRRQMRDTIPSRAATIGLLLAVAVLSGLGVLDGGLAWLLLLEFAVRAVAWLHSAVTERRSGTSASAAAAAAAAARRPAPSPPPMESASPPAAAAAAALDDDDDVIELDTDAYRRQTAGGSAAQTSGPLAGFPFPLGQAGGGDLGALGLPPALDGALKGFSLLQRYVTLTRQLLADALLFLCVTVLTDALRQISQAEREHYTIQ